MSEDIRGSFEERTGPDGSVRPWFVVPFDKEGRSTAPQTVESLLETVSGGGDGEYTDIVVFCHGWNNDWRAASDRYRGFMDNMETVRRDHAPRSADDYRPLLVGLTWPSTALVLPWERGPRFAGAGGSRSFLDEPSARELIEGTSPTDREELRTLLGRERLDPAEAARLAELEHGPFADAEELLVLWRELEADLASLAEPAGASDEVSESGFVEDSDINRDEPRAAGGRKSLDPRHFYRLLTVWQMKDRAGVVGEKGLGPLLAELDRRAGNAKLHLVGHSFGARVVLSAMASGAAPRVRSMLLLQPAVSAWCFAERVPGTSGLAGGYRPVLDRVELPIYTTYSKLDGPLHRFFHLALRRRRDLGEIRAAAPTVPKYAALGGFGPQGIEGRGREIEIPLAGKPYPAPAGEAVLALQGHRRIHGHGDVVSSLTAWALCSLIDAPGA